MAKDKDHKPEAKGKGEQKAPQKTAQPQAKARELYAKAQAGGIEEAKNRLDALTQ